MYEHIYFMQRPLMPTWCVLITIPVSTSKVSSSAPCRQRLYDVVPGSTVLTGEHCRWPYRAAETRAERGGGGLIKPWASFSRALVPEGVSNGTILHWSCPTHNRTRRWIRESR